MYAIRSYYVRHAALAARRFALGADNKEFGGPRLLPGFAPSRVRVEVVGRQRVLRPEQLAGTETQPYPARLLVGFHPGQARLPGGQPAPFLVQRVTTRHLAFQPGDDLAGLDQPGFGFLRITSYNVCYTKLLRILPMQPKAPAGPHDSRRYGRVPVASRWRHQIPAEPSYNFV